MKNPYGNIYDFLFDETDEEADSSVKNENTAPSEDELPTSNNASGRDESYDMAMQIANTQYTPPRRVHGVNPYTDPANKLDPDSYLNAIFGNEGGQTGVDPANVKGSASGRFGIVKSGRKDIYDMFYSNIMTYNQFEKQYNSNPSFEYTVARRLAQINISKSKTAGEAIGRWYDPQTAQSGNWKTIPRPDYGNKLTMEQYIQRALKNFK